MTKGCFFIQRTEGESNSCFIVLQTIPLANIEDLFFSTHFQDRTEPAGFGVPLAATGMSAYF